MTLLVRVTLAWCAGLLLGLRLAPSLPLCLMLAAVAVAAHMTSRRTIAAALLFATAGLTAAGVRARNAEADCRERIPDGGRVVLTGSPLALPAEGVAVPVRATVLAASGVRCGGVTVRVRVPASLAAVLDSAARSGSAITVSGRWMAYAPRNGWPRRPEYAGGVLADSLVEETSIQASALTRFRIAQQARLRALLPVRWGLAEALLLAQKAGLAPETRARWVAAGLVHMLAISGMHVGLIAAGVIALARLFGLPRRTGRRIALCVTAAYVLFLGAPSAALRALLQAVLLLVAVELQRPAEPFTALAAAGLVILVLDPLSALDPGFQLSFAGMAGLIGWHRPIVDALPARLHRHLREGLAAGIAASALTTPIAALHFGTASWIGVPASIIAVPVMAAALALTLPALLVAALTGAAGGPLAAAADAALRLLDAIAALAAAVPGGHGVLAATTVLYALIAVAVAILVRAAARTRDSAPEPAIHEPASLHERHARRRIRRHLHAGIAAAAAIALLACAPLLLGGLGDAVEIHAIDVGQGDAFAIRTPAGRWILVDAGPRTARHDAGRDRVVPYLLGRGARRLEALILTHPDADHIGGAEAVLDAFDVGIVIDPGLAAGKDIFIDLLSAARRSGQRWVAARAGAALDIDGVRIELLYPLTDLEAAAGANDNSVVFRLGFGSFGALFLGDAPTAVEDTLIALHGRALAVQVLKVGHHGSRTSTGEALLRTARPGIALVSAGRRNRYGHPNRAVLERLREHEVRVLRTDEDGSFIIRAAASGRMDVLVR